MTSASSFLPFAVPDLTEAEVEAAQSTIRSGWLTTGPNTAAFETEFAHYLGDEIHAVAVNSATAGLHLAVEALGIGPGDEVLVPTWTFTASAEVIRYVGATPVFVDVDDVTLNIDLAAADGAVTDRTKAIIPVHFAGLPIPNHQIREFAERHKIGVVEDAAHAFPVLENEAYVGSGHSSATVFSFYATKTITTGEGGMLVTRDPDIANRARVMRLHGISRDVFDRYTSNKPSWQYDVIAPGYKYNMTDVAAAIGRVQLQRAEEMRLNRQRIALRYNDAFGELPVTLPPLAPDPRGHAHHLYVLRLRDDAPIDRNRFITAMTDSGVGTSVHFIPLHRHPYWRDTFALLDNDFPVATAAYEHVVSLPLYSSMTDSDVQFVIDATRRILMA